MRTWASGGLDLPGKAVAKCRLQWKVLEVLWSAVNLLALALFKDKIEGDVSAPQDDIASIA
jgi:hypothetical protein